MSGLKVEWIDRKREPKCPPNPAYPNGIDVEIGDRRSDDPTCYTALPYPAKRCGVYVVRCSICGASAGITTAGRPDDPKSVLLPCKMKGTKQ